MKQALPLALCIVASALASAQEPLDHPRAPRALRGLTVVIDPLPGGEHAVALRAAQYLTRVLEESGAGVALTRQSLAPEPREDVGELAERAGAALVVLVSGESEATEPVAVPARTTPARVIALEGALAERLGEQFASCGREKLEVPSARPTVVIRPLAVPAGADEAPMRRHRPAIHALFDAVIAWAAAERSSLTDFSESRRGDRGRPSRPAASYWPFDRAPQTEEEVAALLTGWRRGYAADRTQVWLEVEVRRDGDGWEMSGSTELPSLARAVRSVLERQGVKPLRGELRLLPEATLGDEPFGLAKDAAVLTWAVPGSATGLRTLDGREQVEQTELRVGEPVRLLDHRNGHLLLHALSGYLGWAPEATIERCTEAEHLAAVDRVTGPAERGTIVAERAISFLGVPYVFGGRSETGIDCSGLCQTAWEDQGVFLPRDARMQILAGALVSTRARPAPLRPGDVLFFSDGTGRISHVGISLGGSRFVHSTPPQVTVNSLDPQDPWYGGPAERFVAAKRPAR